MGKFVWHEYARFVSLTATVYSIWAAFWSVFYRKFFWDFVGGIVRNPGGIQPSPNVSVMITLIVKAPVIQLLSILLGFFVVALDYPAPFLKGTAIYRSLVSRILLLLVQATLAVLLYQGTNGAIWSLIAVGCYIRAQVLDEKIEEAKQNRGKGESA